MKPQIRTYTGGELQCNGYLVTGDGVEYTAIDAPSGFAEWVRRVLPEGGHLTHLLITHQHFDHTADAAQMQRETGCTVHAVSACTPSLSLADQAVKWGIPVPAPFVVAEPLGDKATTAQWGGLNWRIIPLPGHSRDGVAYYLPDAGALFCGDSLFAGSIGRTDLPGGNLGELVSHLRERLFSALPPQTHVFPGHGPSTTLGEELINNPYIA